MFTAESLKKIDTAVAKYPADQKQSAVMAALALAQEEKGHLSPEVMDFVAGYLGMAPVGRHKLCVCTNLPCALSGAVEAADHLKKKLGIDWNQTTPDGRFTLKQGECFGACGDAPVMLVNNKKMASFMTPEAIDKLLAELQK